VKSKEIAVPEVAEQSKIGALFYNLDNLITLQQRKLEALKRLRQGYLQQMFPQEGETVPRIRLAGFDEPWEVRKLGDVASIVGGGTPNTTMPEYWGGTIDWYSPVEMGDCIYVNRSRKKITELGLKRSSAKILPIGTVLFTSRAGIGNTAILRKEGATNQGFQSIIPQENELDSYFIFSKTHDLKRYAETVGAGSTFIEVSGKQMTNMSISLPAFTEQTAIGDFFRTLDQAIILQQSKIEQLQQIKRGYLQRMFV